MIGDPVLLSPVRFTTSPPLLAVLIVFLGAQSFLLSVHDFPLTNSEDVGYLSQAAQGWFVVDPFHGPGFPWAIRLVHLVTPLSWLRSAQLVSISAGVTLVVATYVLARRNSSRVLSGVAAATAAFSPVVLGYSCMLMSDALAGALVWAALAFITAEGSRASRRFAIAGTLVALAYLTRSVCGIAALCPLIVLARRQTNGSDRLKRAAAFYGSFGLIAAAWLVVRLAQRGNPFFDHNHLNIAFNMYRDGHGWNVFPTIEEYPSLSAVFRSDPSLFLRAWARNLFALPLQFLGLVPLGGITLGVIGSVLWLKAISPARLAVAFFCATYATAVALTWFEPRFLLPLVPLLAIWVSVGLEAIPTSILLKVWKSSDHRAIAAGRAILASGLLIATGNELRRIPSQLLREQADEYREAADWIRRQRGSGRTVVMSAKPHIPFYAGATAAKFRDSNLQELRPVDLEAALHRVNPTYFVYDERYAKKHFPHFAYLLQPKTRAPEFLKPVYSIKAPRRLVIYRYVGSKTRLNSNGG